MVFVKEFFGNVEVASFPSTIAKNIRSAESKTSYEEELFIKRNSSLWASWSAAVWQLYIEAFLFNKYCKNAQYAIMFFPRNFSTIYCKMNRLKMLNPKLMKRKTTCMVTSFLHLMWHQKTNCPDQDALCLLWCLLGKYFDFNNLAFFYTWWAHSKYILTSPI